ncbi:MAG: peroxiredoxin family protein [Actinomycetota bacterium]|nr:peroxiredoxin family protein [Actinomycetota bacterium]
MTTSTRRAPKRTRAGTQHRAEAARRAATRRLLVRVAVLAVIAVGILYFVTRRGGDEAAGPDGPPFAVGEPGPGSQAPAIELASTAGTTYNLAVDGAGKTVLLYFQEGIGCQPCWTQMTDIEDRFADFETLGIDQMVTITVDNIDDLRRKSDDEGISSLVLADPEVSLGDTYTANQYGMMGTSTYGHTFIVVGPDGTIRWRADYGGSPNYTMYVEPDALLADLSEGLASAS